ncbi:MAG: VCBS repeat-containing protein, partial [Dysgonamonadaceae bacterium]|nr:VCBS repeat-containing protein [Dysgonamonadaceae bacterium]
MKRTAHLQVSAVENRCTALFGLHPSCFVLKKKSFFFFLLALFWGLQLQAQLALKAKPLNIFVQPSQLLSPPDTIDVLSKSELSSCGVSGTTVQLLDVAGTLQHGTAGFDPISKAITYKPKTDFIGQDSLKYRLICGTQIETAVVLINVGDKPKVIIDDACAVVPAGVNWSIAAKTSIAHNLSPYLGVVVGDIDNDGIVEIIAAANPQQDGNSPNGFRRETKSIAIYKGNNIEAPPFVFDTEKPYSWSNSLGKFGIVKTRINNQDTTLIVVWECDRYLRAYNYNGDKVWQSNVVYHSNQYGQTDGSNHLGMSFADFNKDGIPEILISTKLFNSATGELLCSRSWESTTSPYAADLYGNGKLNYVVGHRIYDIDIQSLEDMTQNAFNLIDDGARSLVSINPSDVDYPGSSKTVPDEGKSVAVDVDHDGRLDLVIASNNLSGQYTVLWIYDPVQKIVKATKYLPKAGVCGYPFVGDIDGDGNVEIVLIKNQTSYSSNQGNPTDNIFAYKYNPESPILEEFWRLPHSDPSGVTGITLFDFDQDGKAELIYRDENSLRIIDGTADGDIRYPDNRNKASFSNILSGTGYEYPVVADVDGDGQAEIIVIGGQSGTGNNPYMQDGFLWVFKSANADAPWAPARPVWNQYCYNPVYVNDDLSIPANPLNPATFFVDKDGNYLQPFNNFLQQATLLNDQGKMLSYGPKLEYDNTLDQVIEYTDFVPFKSVNAEFTVINTGDADFKGPLYISAYFLNGSNLEFLQTLELGAGDEDDEGYIKKGDSKSIVFPVNFSTLEVEDPRSFFQIRLNDDGGGNPVSSLCSYFGTYSRPPFYAPDYFLHHGENTIYYYPPNSGYTYAWYKEYPNVDDKPEPDEIGDSYTFTPTHTVQKFHVEVYNGTTLIELRPPVNTYLLPDSLVWTGNATAGSQDWNDPKNWYYPNDPDPEISGIDTV